MAVAVDSNFFNTLPLMDQVAVDEAEMAWLIYDLTRDTQQNRYQMALSRTVYTKFNAALEKITRAESGNVQDFIDQLQEKLDEKLENNNPPDAPTLFDALGDEG